MSFETTLAAFHAANPGIGDAEVFAIDLNGKARGKHVPIAALSKVAAGTMKLPCSTPGLDVFSHDVEGAGLAVETGDPDGTLDPVTDSLSVMDWTDPPLAQLQVTVRMPDGAEAEFDPRNVLARVVARARARGLEPVIAMEQEFFLIDPDEARPPVSPFGGRLEGGQVFDLEVGRAFRPVLDGIAASVARFGGKVEGMVTEFASGQFEINMTHAGALTAADQSIWLRRAIRGHARMNGHDATFMAKPWGETLGSGLHLHCSFLDADGRNVFDAPGDGPGPTLRHAVAGMLAAMPDAMLVAAPHLNSYRRFVPGSLAPVEATWSGDNRGAAIRIPETSGPGARFEHRLAGSDANPYLLAAIVIGAALDGMEAGAEPPRPVTGQIVPGMGAPLPLEWGAAIDRFDNSDFIARTLGEQTRHVFTAMKRQEQAVFHRQVSEAEHAAYLRKL